MTASREVLITGANGFLGSHLVRAALARGDAVHAYTRGSSDFTRLCDVAGQVTHWHGDITDADSLAKGCRDSGAEVIFHCAGQTSGRRLTGNWDAIDQAMRVNLRGTLALLRGAASEGSRVRRVVRIGGLEEYGTAATPWSEEMREQPSSPYSASQVAATHAIQALQPQLPFEVVSLRPALIYGPGQSTDFFIPALITTLLRGDRFAMTSGAQHRDLLHVDDFVSAAFLATAASALGGRVINISTGVEWPIAEVARQIAALIGAEDRLDVGALPDRPGELQHLVARNERAATWLGWTPQIELPVGLERTVESYRKQAIGEIR